MDQFIILYLKLFFMMTPFFVMSAFIAMTKHASKAEKKRIIFKICVAVFVTGMLFFLFGIYIFDLFGITLDAFKIGAGTVLFLSAIDMIRQDDTPTAIKNTDNDIAIVPLAIPITIGPGLIGVLMVYGAEPSSVMHNVIVCMALLASVVSVGLILLISNKVQHLLGKQGLKILPKITGLFVSAIGAQIIFSGIQGFFKL
ncbi:MarC family protein [Marinifaba aquimaris]|uniref:MarC family protein n=1 Tax=Marinifaba aquimaris TaxID=2741323 RepID=UPI0031B5E313